MRTAGSVLIADDDEELAKALRLRCESLGLKTTVAHSGLAALNCIHSDPPSVVCLDVNMPGGSGLSVCEMLSSDERLASIPVIIVTGSIEKDTVRRCHFLCAYYVLKSQNVWERVEPLLRELLGLDTTGPALQLDEASHTSVGKADQLAESQSKNEAATAASAPDAALAICGSRIGA